MSDIKMSVVNSTVGLGETEYSLCDNKGMLKYDKPALDECCEVINNHDTMQARINKLEEALSDIYNSSEENQTLILANKALEK